jgi:hypothetical protein
MIGDRDLGKNWHLRFRKIINKLKQKNERLYLENQIMKRRLAKYEGSRRMVTYFNKKVSA